MRLFLTRFVGLQIAMVLGATVCYVVGGRLRASPEVATVYYPGSVLFFAGDIFFLTAPVVAWIVVRGRGWRHGVGIAIAMLLPVAAIVVAGVILRSDHLRFLVDAMYPAMTAGMLLYLRYRWRGPAPVAVAA